MACHLLLQLGGPHPAGRQLRAVAGPYGDALCIGAFSKRRGPRWPRPLERCCFPGRQRAGGRRPELISLVDRLPPGGLPPEASVAEVILPPALGLPQHSDVAGVGAVWTVGCLWSLMWTRAVACRGSPWRNSPAWLSKKRAQPVAAPRSVRWQSGANCPPA